MPSQSKFIRFLRRCCCCCVDSSDEQGKINKKENKKSKKAKNNKKLRQKERRDRRDKKSKKELGNVNHQTSAQTNNFDDAGKQPPTSSSLPVPNNSRVHPRLLWKTKSVQEYIRFEKSPIEPQSTSVVKLQSTLSITSLTQIQITFPSSPHYDISSKYVFKTNEDKIHSTSFYSWSDLDISLHRLFHIRVQAMPSSFSSDSDLHVSLQRLFGIKHPQMTSSFSSWKDTISSLQCMFEGIGGEIKPEAGSGQTQDADYPSTLPSMQNSSLSAILLSSSSEDTRPSLSNTPTPLSLEAPKSYRSRKPSWPLNPWLAPKYNGYPETIPTQPRWYEHTYQSEEILSQKDDEPEEPKPDVMRSVPGTEMEDTPCVLFGDTTSDDAQNEQNTTKVEAEADEKDDQGEEEASSDIRQMDSLVVPKPTCSGDNRNEMVGDQVPTIDAASQEEVISQEGNTVTEQRAESTHESEIVKRALSGGGSDMSTNHNQPGATVDHREEKDGIYLMLSHIQPFPLREMKDALIPKLSLPSHVYSERLSQFNVNRASRDTNACAINHTLLAVTYYSFGMQSGDLLDSHSLKSLQVQKWLWKTINLGNLLHRSLYEPSDCILATDAFKIVKSTFTLRGLVWRGCVGAQQGLPSRLRMLPRNLSLDIVNPTNKRSSLAYHVSKLNPYHMEAMLYTINNSFFLLLPTDDDRVVLIDIHPHPTFGGGAVIMFCTNSESGVQDMLDEFYFRTIKPFHRFNLGQGNIICCKLESENKLIPRNLKEWIDKI